MSGFRLADGGRIDRRTKRNFTFDGKARWGYAGDSLASALLAQGQMLFGRSFKYHRPRGILGAGVEEPNALVTVDRGPGRVTPNLRAPSVALHRLWLGRLAKTALAPAAMSAVGGVMMVLLGSVQVRLMGKVVPVT